MKELQTYLGKDIPLGTLGILYICDLTANELKVVNEIFFECPGRALDTYANVMNPESQLMCGNTYDELIEEVHKLHKSMKNPKFIEHLNECC